MEALWSRFLPAYVFLAEQLKAKTIGEIYSVEASFGFANLDAVARVSEKKLGGGTILDLGVYTLNLIQMAFGNEQPEKVAAVGALNSSGVDASVAAALSYSGGRSAVMRTHSVVEMPNTATLIGTKGTIRLEKYFHCAQKVLLNGQEHAFPYPANTPEMNFPDGRGLRFEADHVRELLVAGKRESPVMPHRDSLTLARISDEIRRQIGVVFPADQQ